MISTVKSPNMIDAYVGTLDTAQLLPLLVPKTWTRCGSDWGGGGAEPWNNACMIGSS